MSAKGIKNKNVVHLPMFAIPGLEGRERCGGYGVSCPELWGNMMLGWKREEGRAPGPVEGPTSSLPRDLWDLTHGLAGRCRACVGGSADAKKGEEDT